METKHLPLVAAVHVLLLLLLCSGFATADSDGDEGGGESGPAKSSPAGAAAARCAAKLGVSPHLIPFDTSSLSCVTAWSSRDFVLLYKRQDPSLWSFVLSAPDGKGYVAVGFSGDGKMVGSSAVAGWINGGGVGVAKQYYLGGETSGRCPPNQGSLPLKGAPLIISQSSRLYLAFQLNTSSPPSARLIYAQGPPGSLPGADNLLPEHRSMVSTSLDYATGQGSTDGGPSSLKETHGALGLVGWGVLVPVGVLAARYGKGWDPQWFYTHTAVQIVGFGLGVACVVTGFSLEDDVGKDVDTHKAIGIVVLVLGSLQVMAFLARPEKASKVRKYWNWYHHNVGRAAGVLAVANIFYGLSLADEESSWSIGYGVFLGIWFLVCLILEIRTWTRK